MPIKVNDSDETASTSPEIVFDDIKEAVEGMVSRVVELADEYTSTYVPVKVDKSIETASKAPDIVFDIEDVIERSVSVVSTTPE